MIVGISIMSEATGMVNFSGPYGDAYVDLHRVVAICAYGDSRKRAVLTMMGGGEVEVWRPVAEIIEAREECFRRIRGESPPVSPTQNAPQPAVATL